MQFVEQIIDDQNDKVMQMCCNNHYTSHQRTKLNKVYQWQLVIASLVIQQKIEEPQTAVSPLLGLISVAY